MPGNKYYEDLKSAHQWETHQETLKKVYTNPKRYSPEEEHHKSVSYIPQKEYQKLKPKKPQWTAEDQKLEDELWES